MIKKIIGVTVGTTMNPKKLAGNMPAHGYSWNDLTDKPFYEIPGKETTVTFNGDISEKETFGRTIGSGGEIVRCFVKVSDVTPEPTELMNAKVIAIQNGVEMGTTITQYNDLGDVFSGFPSGHGYIVAGGIVVIQNVVTMDDATISTGLYFLFDGENQSWYTSLTYGEPEQVKQLDMKFIPDAMKTCYVISEGEMKEFTFDGDITKANVVCETDEDGDGVSDSFIIKFSGDAPEPSDFIGGKLAIVYQGNDIEQEVVVTEEVLQGEGVIADIATNPSFISGSGYYLGGDFIVITEDTKLDIPYADESREVSFSKGVYGMYANIPSVGTVYTSKVSYKGSEQIKQLDEKFIPDAIARKEYVDALKTYVDELFASIEVLPSAEEVKF